MKRVATFSLSALALALLALPATASAEQEAEPVPETEPAPEVSPETIPPENVETTDPYRPDLRTGFGVGAMVGGGLMNFLNDDVRDFVDVGGAWNARLIFGTRSMLAAELEYNGSAQDVEALGLDTDAVLLGSGATASARMNLTDEARIQPFFLAGFGWQNYTIVNEDFNESNMRDDDNLYQIPLGVGLDYRQGGFLADLRGKVSILGDNDLIVPTDRTDDTELHNWSVNLSLGWEF